MNCTAEAKKTLVGVAEPCDEDRTDEINKFQRKVYGDYLSERFVES